jgi:hypothetical protein
MKEAGLPLTIENFSEMQKKGLTFTIIKSRPANKGKLKIELNPFNT